MTLNCLLFTYLFLSIFVRLQIGSTILTGTAYNAVGSTI